MRDKMKIIKTVKELQELLQREASKPSNNQITNNNNNKSSNKTIANNILGFVPTMGFLHDGHLSLIRRAKNECHKVIVSIFVNPTQFSPNEDFSKYPRDFERDKMLLESEGVDILFYPDESEIYPNGERITINFPSSERLSNKLCGLSRPTHFKGVCMAVKRLFDIVQPNKAYFGLKDYQQYLIITKMAEELNIPINIIGCPIIREYDGLAMSSRNTYLT